MYLAKALYNTPPPRAFTDYLKKLLMINILTLYKKNLHVFDFSFLNGFFQKTNFSKSKGSDYLLFCPSLI